MEFHILRTWASEALRATLEPGVDGSSEHGAGALIQEKHDVSNTSESTLIPCVGRHETSGPSGECGSVLGMIDMYLDRYGGSGMERKRQRKNCSGKSNLDILGHDSQTFEESGIKSVK